MHQQEMIGDAKSHSSDLWLPKMPLLLLTLCLCSCSPRPVENTGLPNYDMMQAAEDAGKTPSK
jgi:hypothetical protein